MIFRSLLPVLLLGVVLTACAEEEVAEVPPPIEVTAEATGHYCGMLLKDHEGPKGQIHLAGGEDPVWFSSVRDTVAFTRLPEEPKTIVAIYVNDMGQATNWSEPEPGTWVEAREAWFVLGSRRLSGMGAPEAVPFSGEEAAHSFAAAHGGTVVRFDKIPDSYVLGTLEIGSEPGQDSDMSTHGDHAIN